MAQARFCLVLVTRFLVIASGTLHREMVCSVGRRSIQSMPGTDTRRLAWILIMFPKAGESQEAFHEPSTLVFTRHHCELWEEVRPMLNDSDRVSGTCWIYRNTRVPCDTPKILREFETFSKKKKIKTWKIDQDSYLEVKFNDWQTVPIDIYNVSSDSELQNQSNGTISLFFVWVVTPENDKQKYLNEV